MSEPASQAANARYSMVAIILHWIIAVAIGAMILIGWNMEDNASLYQLHKSIGITILMLTIARIVWRLINRPPPLADDMPVLERTASHLVHLGFYGLMLAMPLTGWLVVSTTYEFNVSTVLFGQISWPDIPGVGFLANEAGHDAVEFVHSKLAWLMIGLLVLHVAGALKHEFMAESGVLKRMIPGLFGKTSGPVKPARGLIPAFGLAAVVFALIAGTPVLLRGGNGPAPDVDLSTANWVVDYDASSLVFDGIYDGEPFTGGFETWSAAINFDPEDLSASHVRVEINTGSVTAIKQRYADDLRTEEWFNVEAFQSAQADLSGFTETAQGYSADLALTVKDLTVSMPFTFTLSIDGSHASMTGQTTLSRTALNLGMISDEDAEWVDDAVTVTVTIEADRKP